MSRQALATIARPTLTTTHTLITGAWTADVRAMETAVGRFTAKQPLTNACQVAFFEVARDGDLHVNVTHKYETAAVKGWAGPARLPQGFVHNRTFGDTPPSRIVRHIREMIFAAKI
jgi:hypothetical protein